MIDEKYMQDQDEIERDNIEEEILQDDELFSEIAVSNAFHYGDEVPDVSFMNYAVDYVKKTRDKAYDKAWMEDAT